MMRLLRPAALALALFAAPLTLGACSLVESVVGQEVPAPQNSREILVAVDEGFQSAVSQAGAAAEAGLLVGADAELAAQAIVAGDAALDAAHDAERNGGSTADYVGAAAQATADILGALGKGN